MSLCRLEIRIPQVHADALRARASAEGVSAADIARRIIALKLEGDTASSEAVSIELRQLRASVALLQESLEYAIFLSAASVAGSALLRAPAKDLKGHEAEVLEHLRGAMKHAHGVLASEKLVRARPGSRASGSASAGDPPAPNR